MFREETAFIWIHCVEREAASDSQSPFLSFPNTPLSLMPQVVFVFFILFLSVPIYQHKRHYEGKQPKYSLYYILYYCKNHILVVVIVTHCRKKSFSVYSTSVVRLGNHTVNLLRRNIFHIAKMCCCKHDFLQVLVQVVRQILQIRRGRVKCN